MRFGVTLPPFGVWSDPRTVMDMATDAEAAGWDGFFVWDHITWNPDWGGVPPIADPWICLAAVAAVTERVVLGPMVTPLARRRPHKVARELVTLDHLSRGRVVFGVGLGVDIDYSAFGEPTTGRGRRLDDALEILTDLLTGEPVTFDSTNYKFDSPPALPRPVHDRIPIWVGGMWPNRAPFARAARYDGCVPMKDSPGLAEALMPAELVEIRAAVGRTEEGYDYVASGSTTGPNDTAAVTEWADAGATWWIEGLAAWHAAEHRDRIRAGPPRID